WYLLFLQAGRWWPERVGVAANGVERREGLLQRAHRDDGEALAGALPGLVVLPGRDEEVLGPRLFHCRRLLGDAADLADRPVRGDRPGHRDLLPAGQIARG